MFHFIVLRRNDDFLVTTLRQTVSYNTIDLSNNCWIRRVTCFKQFRYARKTTRDITSSSSRTRNFRQYITTLNGRTLLGNQDSTHRHVEYFGYFIVTFYTELRHLRLIATFYNHQFRQSCLLITLFTHVHTFNDVFVSHLTINVGNDQRVKRIPCAHNIAFFRFLSFFYHQNGTIRNIVSCDYSLGLRFQNSHFARTTQYDFRILGFAIFIGIKFGNCTHSVEANHTFVFGCQCVFRSNVQRRTTRVESTQRQLSSWFTNRLCSNYAHGLTRLNHSSSRQVTTITSSTNTCQRFASQYRTDFQLFNSCILNGMRNFFCQFLTSRNNQLTRFWMINSIQRSSTQDTFVQRLRDFIVIHQCTHRNTS